MFIKGKKSLWSHQLWSILKISECREVFVLASHVPSVEPDSETWTWVLPQLEFSPCLLSAVAYVMPWPTNKSRVNNDLFRHNWTLLYLSTPLHFQVTHFLKRLLRVYSYHLICCTWKPHPYFDSICFMQHKSVHMQINQYTEYVVAVKK